MFVRITLCEFCVSSKSETTESNWTSIAPKKKNECALEMERDKERLKLYEKTYVKNPFSNWLHMELYSLSGGLCKSETVGESQKQNHRDTHPNMRTIFVYQSYRELFHHKPSVDAMKIRRALNLRRYTLKFTNWFRIVSVFIHSSTYQHWIVCSHRFAIHFVWLLLYVWNSVVALFYVKWSVYRYRGIEIPKQK